MQRQPSQYLSGIRSSIMNSKMDLKEQNMKELQRMLRVSDMMITAYSRLRGRYAFFSTSVDILILFLSAWLSALAFASENIMDAINPTGVSNQLFIGFIAVTTFIISLIQLKVDWKSKASAYANSAKVYSSFKLELRRVLGDSSNEIDGDTLKVMNEKYITAGDFTVPIPEDKFVALKKAHLMKIEISKALDHAPASSLLLLKVKFWLRDNYPCKK